MMLFNGISVAATFNLKYISLSFRLVVFEPHFPFHKFKWYTIGIPLVFQLNLAFDWKTSGLCWYPGISGIPAKYTGFPIKHKFYFPLELEFYCKRIS